MALRGPPGDPRAVPLGPGEGDVRPMVALPRGGLPGWAIAAVALVAAIILFIILDARRRAPTTPDVRVRAVDSTGVRVPPPPLYVPPEPAPPVLRTPPPAAAPAPAPAPVQPQIIYVPQPAPVTDPVDPPAPPPRTSTEPAVVVDTGAAPAAPSAEGGSATPGAPASITGGRARAGMFANRSTTVVQGTLIPAVLETALDSTRPGLARAIVSRDVRGFDGSRVLIPRGSRLIGEYRSEVATGQRRALVNWTRLIRPDGVTMAIGSPAGDPLGRAGIRASVNTHFFERFAGAILQSALDIGVNLAAGAGGGTVVVLPGTVQGTVTPQIVQPSQVTPTLRVRQGTSISIFVARDLDFTRAARR